MKIVLKRVLIIYNLPNGRRPQVLFTLNFEHIQYTCSLGSQRNLDMVHEKVCYTFTEVLALSLLLFFWAWFFRFQQFLVSYVFFSSPITWWIRIDHSFSFLFDKSWFLTLLRENRVVARTTTPLPPCLKSEMKSQSRYLLLGAIRPTLVNQHINLQPHLMIKHHAADATVGGDRGQE